MFAASLSTRLNYLLDQIIQIALKYVWMPKMTLRLLIRIVASQSGALIRIMSNHYVFILGKSLSCVGIYEQESLKQLCRV